MRCLLGVISWRFFRAALALATLVFAGLLGVSGAAAVDAVNIRLDAAAIDLTDAVEYQHTDGDRAQVSTAPGADGIVRRIEVRAREAGNNWAVFALANNGDEQIDRLIVAPHYRMVGSGLIWPDLGLSRIVSITPSSGDPPERIDNATADVFRITLDPGTVITFVAELRTPILPQLYLWEPDEFKDKVNSLTLYQGIVIGIAGLLALFLTILFVVKGSVMFPRRSGARLGGADLYRYRLRLLGQGVRDVVGRRAHLARLRRGDPRRHLAGFSVRLSQSQPLARALCAHHRRLAFVPRRAGSRVALYSPPVASGVARISLFFIAVLGFALVLYLSTHGFDRAVMLIPTWLLLVAWTFGAALTIFGFVTNDIVGPALLGGLVLIVMLIGFTVMQHAFAGGMAQGIVSDVERRALALTGAGDMIWDWDVAADRVFTSPETETMLGLKAGALAGSAASWLEVLHPLDRDRFRATLDGIVDQRRGRVSQDFRMRAADGHYLWFALRARPVVGSDGEVIRLVGTLTDVTDVKTAEERLLHDAVHDNLTGLPNRELFLDRLDAIIGLAKADSALRPTVIGDRCRPLQAGQRLGRHGARRFDPADTGAPARPADQAARHARAHRRRSILAHSLVGAGTPPASPRSPKPSAAPCARRSPSTIAKSSSPARSASRWPTSRHSAPRNGSRTPSSRCIMPSATAATASKCSSRRCGARKSDRLTIESDLRRALERDEITILYQPIVRLDDRAVAGFEALARWNHPKLGRMAPNEFIAIAEETGLIVELGLFVLERSARQLSTWQRTLRPRENLFVSVNVSSRQLLRHDLIQDLRMVLARAPLTRGSLKLEITESVVMENPEHAAQMLHRIRELGAGLALDDFGTGYSSLAYLQRFPFDTIKIDKSFVHTTAKGTRPVILRSIIALAHDLGMDVVAEGAETDSDAVELYQLGCEYAQGFVFGQPIDAGKGARPAAAARQGDVKGRMSEVR